jgi:hypothetical protein
MNEKCDRTKIIWRVYLYIIAQSENWMVLNCCIKENVLKWYIIKPTTQKKTNQKYKEIIQ